MATIASNYVNHTHTGAQGPAGSSGLSFATGSISSTYTIKPNPNSKIGEFQFTADGQIQVYDGKDWVVVAGLEKETQIDKIKAVLREFYPEVLFDLVMRELL